MVFRLYIAIKSKSIDNEYRNNENKTIVVGILPDWTHRTAYSTIVMTLHIPCHFEERRDEATEVLVQESPLSARNILDSSLLSESFMPVATGATKGESGFAPAGKSGRRIPYFRSNDIVGGLRSNDIVGGLIRMTLWLC